MDCLIAGYEVDIKCTVRGTWTIPSEAIGQICLLIRIDDNHGRLDIGLLRMLPEFLNPGKNRDGKSSVRAASLLGVIWLLKNYPMEKNLLSTLPTEDRDAILSGSSGQRRIDELFRRVNDQIINRTAIETVAKQLDPMKRVRDARRRLAEEGYLVLGHQSKDPEIARRLGLPIPQKGEAICTRRHSTH